ncbi:fungal Zn(2)-cys(6) binuclear cluster domain protein [Rhizoctonia solani AG-3 Rhs1AP]|uniref:Fungal Zn(2)-cys(6) binuclear cluster domain protein n=1 Tax=Rhizoctonia solani AG-3 Rhs1AP TaxID=1086054 RepID=X8J5Q6_9AGAM|nr:fungal Zn(2)-cys(6) binuclear cluster domain protein [Rhizoctonia solani AG-3 Rhs1AP]
MGLSAPATRFQRSRNGCLTCKSKRKKCNEKRPICSRCDKADSDCVWPSNPHTLDPWTELVDIRETIHANLLSPSYSTQPDIESNVPETEQTGSSVWPEAHLRTDPGLPVPGFEPTCDRLEGTCLTHYHNPNSTLFDGYRMIDTGNLATSSKLWEFSQEYGPKVIWPPVDDEEKDSFDPEGIMPLIQQSVSTPRVTDDPIFQDVRDFFATFLSRFFYDYAAIHGNLHVRIRRRFGASDTLRQGMLGMAALFRSNYGHSLVPTSMRNYAKKLYQLASHTLQLELENSHISAWTKLAGLWELMNYEYYAGNLSSYYQHLNQAASIVRLAIGSNSIDILKLSGEQTFDLRCFAWCDILSSMALSRPTLLNYESNIHNPPPHGDSADPDKGVEWIFGCPDVLTILLARTSVLRHACVSTEEKVARGREIQQLMQDWQFQPLYSQRSALRVARLAAQEIWRHAAILYVHQSIFKSDSSHPLVKNSVKTIIQIVSTLTPGVNPDCFLSVPYFIAGSFATTTRDRYTLRSRILSSGNEIFLRNLATALDDSWRATDSTGSLTTWSQQHPPRIIF